MRDVWNRKRVEVTNTELDYRGGGGYQGYLIPYRVPYSDE